MATITLDREAYTEYRCFGMPDEYPKDIRKAVNELRRRGYDASLGKLQYMIETEQVVPETDRWTEEDTVAKVLAENEVCASWLAVRSGRCVSRQPWNVIEVRIMTCQIGETVLLHNGDN